MTSDNKRGYIALARGILNHPVVCARKPYSDFEAWCWLIFEAVYTPQRVRLTNGRAVEFVELKRGQVAHSLRYMATAWGWSDKRVRGFLFRLKRDRQIDAQTGHLQTVINLCNYERYQTPEEFGGRTNGRAMDAQWTQRKER